MNEQEVRHLLISDEWPEDYQDAELYTIANDIFQEWDKLSGEGNYKNSLKEKGLQNKQHKKIKFLYGIIKLYELDKKLAFEILKSQGYKYKTIDEVIRSLENRLFDIKVEEERKKADESKKDKFTFNDLIIPIESHFRIQIDYNIPVAKYLAYKNRMKKDG